MDPLVVKTSSQHHQVQWNTIENSVVITAITTSGQGFTKKTTELLCHHALRLEDHPLIYPFMRAHCISLCYLLALSMVIAEVEAGPTESLRVGKISQDHQH